MPEDGTESNETISMEEYKKLQRKFDRVSKKATHADERSETSDARLVRLESLVEGLTALVGSDEDLKPAADELLQKNSQRRSTDDTSGQLTARLNQIVDDADESWDDDKFDSARDALDSMNESGDLTRAGEVERLIHAALTPKDERTMEEIVQTAVEAALHGEKRDAKRVDTGGSTVHTGRVTRADIGSIDPREGIDAMREKMDAALDQITA